MGVSRKIDSFHGRISASKGKHYVSWIGTALFIMWSAIGGCADVGRHANIVSLTDPSASKHHVALKKTPKFYAQSEDGACWLACARMVYAYKGKNVTEAQLNQWVTSVTQNNRGKDLHASERECLIALAPDMQGGWIEALRRQMSTGGVSVKVNVWNTIKGTFQNITPITGQDLVNALNHQEPVVIVCRNGPWTKAEHAMVVIGATYGLYDNSKNDVPIASVEVLDPASESGTADVRVGEFLNQNIRGIYTMNIASEELRREMKAVKVGPYQSSKQNGDSDYGPNVTVNGSVNTKPNGTTSNGGVLQPPRSGGTGIPAANNNNS